MKTIVIIGASGIVVVNLIHDLLKKTYKVIATTRNINEAINNIKSKYLKLVKVDLNNLKEILKVITLNCVVINLSYNWHGGKVYNFKLTNSLL